MVKFVDAVKSVSVKGHRKKLKGRPKEQVVRMALSKYVPLDTVNFLKTETKVNSGFIGGNVKNTIQEIKTKLDFCGEWAPWTKLGK